MAAQPEHRLALALIRSHFGDVPLKISSLLVSGRLSFIQLGRASHLRVSQARFGFVCLVFFVLAPCSAHTNGLRSLTFAIASIWASFFNAAPRGEGGTAVQSRRHVGV